MCQIHGLGLGPYVLCMGADRSMLQLLPASSSSVNFPTLQVLDSGQPPYIEIFFVLWSVSIIYYLFFPFFCFGMLKDLNSHLQCCKHEILGRVGVSLHACNEEEGESMHELCCFVFINVCF